MRRSAGCLLSVVLSAAALTAGLDELLLARVRAGSDHALRLSVVLAYVGVDGSYTLARAFGFAALAFSYVAVLLGLETARRRRSGSRVPDWAPVVHRQIGLVTLVLVAGHLAVPFTSVDRPYGGWATSLVPWGQPVSWGIKAATWQAFGILAFYLALLTGPTYYLLHRRYGMWVAVHRASTVVYGLAVAHAFLLGTDFMVRGPLRVILLSAQIPLALLLIARLGRPAARAAAGLLALGATTLAVMVGSGMWAGGRVL